MLVPEVYEIKLLPGVGYLSINLLGIEPGIEDKVNKRATAKRPTVRTDVRSLDTSL